MCNAFKQKKYIASVDWGNTVATGSKNNGRIIWHNDSDLSENFISDEDLSSVVKEVWKILRKYAEEQGAWSESHTATVRPYKDGYANREEDIEVTVFAPCKDSSKGDFVRVRAQESWF